MTKKIYFIVGPSGSGKDTMVKKAIDENVGRKLVSHTTRNPREGEVDGYDYNFISKDGIKELIKEDINTLIDFLEGNSRVASELKRILDEDDFAGYVSLIQSMDFSNNVKLNFPQLIYKEGLNGDGNFYGYSTKEFEKKDNLNNIFIIVQPDGIDQLINIANNIGIKYETIYFDISPEEKLNRIINREGKEKGLETFNSRKNEDQMFIDFRDNSKYKKQIINTSGLSPEEVFKEFKNKINKKVKLNKF